ncbi:MAG: NADH-quinone oxidoreductase subunit N [Chloroflexi bacterium]|nr:NADH-quinone oxidoreductase subunit N [Chloroflexota bacterium]
MPDINTWLLISPELILTVVGLLIVVVDLVWREQSEPVLPWLAVLGFALALGATINYWGANQSLFAGMYAVDTYALFFKLISALAGLLTVLVSISFLKGRTPFKGDFYFLLTYAVLATMMMASSTSLLMVYLSIEFLSYTSYLLAGFLREDKKSNEAAIKYFLYGAVTSAVMLYGLSLLYGISGSLNLADMAQVFATATDASTRELGLVAFALVLAGFGFKISAVPFHQWAPDVYEGAPTPIVAFLSVGSKAAGFALLMRVALTAFPGFQTEWAALLSVVSIMTMTLGNLVALQQKNIKRLLAYSSIAQAGYILIGLVSVKLGGASPFAGLNGVLIYLAAYLFTNLGAFIVVVAIESATGAVEIPEYAGLIKRAPLLAALLVIFFLSLAGIPPTAGFIGKFFVFGAALKEGYLALAAIGVVNSVVSVFYYFSVVRAAFFDAPKTAEPIRVPMVVTASVVACAAVVLLLAVFPQQLIDLAAWGMRMVAVAKP